MAHWDEERDQHWVQMMKDCNVPDSDGVIKNFEDQGNDIYFYQFLELMRKDQLLRQQKER